MFLVIAALAGFGAGRYWKPKPTLEVAAAIPSWIPQRKDPTICAEPTETEQEVFRTAVQALAVAPRSHSWLAIGATRFLSHGLYREADKESVPVCPPSDTYARALSAIEAAKGLNVFLEEYQLELAGRLPNPSDYVVERVAAVAFAEKPHIRREQYLPPLDLRPLARTVLASYGRRAEKFRDRAFEEISADDSLGTGAAQIAASTGHPAALPRVKALMEAILARTPAAEPIGLEERRRLYELAYAMYFAGAKAKEHAAPIQELLKRNVKSRAPPFGLVDLSPKQICHVLDGIFGNDQSPSRSHPFCNDKTYPYPQ